MATATKKAAASPDKPKRRMLTPSERLAAAEAEVARLRDVAAAKNKAKAVKLNEERKVLEEKRSKIVTRIEAIDAELESFGLSEDTEQVENQLSIDDAAQS